MRIATYNVQSLSGKAELVERLVQSTGLDIIGLTETWMRPTDRFLLPMQYEAVTLDPPGRCNRGEGGIALAWKVGVKGIVRYRQRDRKVQILVVKIAGCLIALVYFSPSARREEVENALTKLRQVCRGPTIILGDLNARHNRWDRTTNRFGSTILKWAEKYSWTIRAAQEPTFVSRTGRSNIDLFITKDLQAPLNPWIPHGDWDGMSDHNPVVLEITVPAPVRETGRRRVAWRKRTDPDCLQQSRDVALKENPGLIAAIKAANSITELNRVYMSGAK